MAFNKVSMVLLLLFLVASTMAKARNDLFDSSSEFQSSEEEFFCSSCACTTESGIRKCVRSERKIGSCPLVCGSSCICNPMQPPRCFCNYEVETCFPKACPTAATAAFELENLLVQLKP